MRGSIWITHCLRGRVKEKVLGKGKKWEIGKNGEWKKERGGEKKRVEKNKLEKDRNRHRKINWEIVRERKRKKRERERERKSKKREREREREREEREKEIVQWFNFNICRFMRYSMTFNGLFAAYQFANSKTKNPRRNLT